jgi:ABC-type glycerol-3-phosphate transport system substrate-binding protein
MSNKKNLSRRRFLELAGAAAAGSLLAACGAEPEVVEKEVVVTKEVEKVVTKEVEIEKEVLKEVEVVVTATPEPAAMAEPRQVRLAVGGWAQEGTQNVLDQLGFTDQSGIEVEIVLRTDTKETELTRLASAVQAGTSPYDVIDFEDELTTSFSQAGYMLPLDDLVSKEVWDDFDPSMKSYSDVWSTHEGQLFRVIHNWEMPYWFYRKDWFDEKGVAVPETWEDVQAMGAVFTDEDAGVWATVDGLIKGAFLNVYLAWITLQAGGNPFDLGPEYKTALEYIYDLMYTSKALNPASLQKDYNQQNGDYLADKVAFMRQWPFFADVARSDDNAGWFSEDKVAVALPPYGPGGPENSTYAAGWGFGIINSSPNLDAAKELFQFLISSEVAAEAANISFWYLSARKSVLAAVDQDNHLVQMLKMYSDAGVIGVRPHHPKFVEALNVLEDTAAAYLTDQISIDDSLSQAQDRLASL